MKLYIDVSNLMMVNFVTGIQRVVREIVLRLLKKDQFVITLLKYDEHIHEFFSIDNQKFYNFYKYNIGVKNEIITSHICKVNDMHPDATFFEIDSVWNSPYRRTALLPELKRRGLKIASYVYDTIPIIHPQFCHTNTLYKFMDYFGAVIQYADELVVSTQGVLDSIYEITDRLGLKRIQGCVSWLGSDFPGTAEKSQIDESVTCVVCSGKKYVLAVGTIEPRKNHKILLDAFEKSLFKEDICLVFVGRMGWNVEALEKRIRRHKQLNSHLFYFEGLDDDNVDYLYRNAYLVAFPTYDEGFGLPMIEAFERGTPVIASDCKVLREVGGDHAVYFPPDSSDAFARQIKRFLDCPEEYSELKDRVKTYVPCTWDQTTDKIEGALLKLQGDLELVQKMPNQLVVLSARCQDICNTLPYIEHYMPFIKRLLLCCPNNMQDEFSRMYRGRLDFTILTDDMVLAGRTLPEDHQTRNFFLRSLIMRREEVDEVFIMSDDDYRPLQEISTDIFLKNNKYQAYYCHSLKTWKGTAGKMTSYDLGMFRTLEFLELYHYPVMQYSSHMPQIIDKKKYQEFLDSHVGVELLGIDEWSGYFNWLQWKYPQIVTVREYVTMCWPGNPTDWKLEVEPEEYHFENYYESLYEIGGIFDGFSKQFSQTIAEENLRKKVLCAERKKSFDKYDRVFLKYKEIYTKQFRAVPSFLFIVGDGVRISMPKYSVFPVNGFVRLPAILHLEGKKKSDFVQISYCFQFAGLNLFERKEVINMPVSEGEFEVPFFTHADGKGKMQLVWSVTYGSRVYKQSMTVFLVDTEGFLKAVEIG